MRKIISKDHKFDYYYKDLIKINSKLFWIILYHLTKLKVSNIFTYFLYHPMDLFTTKQTVVT